jgi:hypothetical protein
MASRVRADGVAEERIVDLKVDVEGFRRAAGSMLLNVEAGGDSPHSDDHGNIVAKSPPN